MSMCRRAALLLCVPTVAIALSLSPARIRKLYLEDRDVALEEGSLSNLQHSQLVSEVANGGDGIGHNSNRELPSDFKVYVHELPEAFNEELLTCYKEQTGMQIWEDESKERAQNSGDVWLHKALLRHSRRTENATEATIFFVPFYGFLSSNLSGRPGYQDCHGLGHWNRTHRLAEWLQLNPHFNSRPEDHVVPVSFWAVARKAYPKWDDELFSVITGELYDILQKSRLLVYEPVFGSYRMAQEYTWWPGPLTAIPYVANTLLIHQESAVQMQQRNTSLYFRGNLALDSSNGTFESEGQALRRKTFEAFGAVTGSRIEDSSINFSATAYTAGMTNSTFCLMTRGDTPTSCRLFDAIIAGCIPVIVSDGIYLPFDGFLDWGKFAIKVPENDVSAGGRTIADFVERISEDTIQDMQAQLRSIREDFIYGYESPLVDKPGRATDNILLAISRGRVLQVAANATY